MSMTTTTSPPARPGLRFTLTARLSPRAHVVAMGILAAILAMSFALPYITGIGPEQFVSRPYSPPSLAHPFGTDGFGRDVMIRTFAAAQIDYLIPLLVVAISVVVGNIIGVAAALVGGIFEWLVMRITDVIIAFPFIILILALVVVFGGETAISVLPNGTLPVIVAISLTGWAYYARLARSLALSLREIDYVTAARVMGYSTWRILLRHMTPKVLGASLSYAIGDIIVVMGLIASLSLFGAGIAPPTAEWGQMMFEGRSSIDRSWWATVFPLGFMIISAVSLAAVAERMVAGIEGRSR